MNKKTREVHVVITAGAGGSESAAWAKMLVEMYSALAGRRGWQSHLVHVENGPDGGYISAILAVRGGPEITLLANESGVHRLTRQSPFDQTGARHTSFAHVQYGDPIHGMPGVVRNYIMHPYQRVKDVRTGVETEDGTGVLAGDLDQFWEPSS